MRIMGEFTSMRRAIFRFMSVLLMVNMIYLLFVPSSIYAAETKGQTVRVGYFAFEGYHNQDEDGKKSGYGYEYLQQMARYAGWDYEYIGYEGSWSDAQKMLENGEIDLLTSAQKTEEREKIFDFSDDPIGYSSTIFTIKSGNDKYTIDNFETFNGIRVGMLEGNSRNQEFADFAKEKGFSYTAVMFDETAGLVDALHAEEIDAIVTSSLRVTKGEWVVSEFGFSPYYVCVKKGNQDLLDQVNSAIDQINHNNPGLQNELENKYYGTDSGEEVAFSEAERNYVTEYIQSGKKLKVMINPDRAPLSYYSNGQMAGIYGEIANKVLERSGLPYEVVEVEDRRQYMQYKEDHLVDLCMDISFDYSPAESLGYKITDSYNSSTVSKVTRESFSGEEESIAAIRNSDIASALEKEVYGSAQLTYYDTGSECIQAVKSGKQDAAYLYTHVAEEVLKDDIQHQLAATLVPDFSTSFCVGIGDTHDATLFSILNKSVESISDEWIDEVTVRYTDGLSGNVSLLEVVYNHPMAVLMAAVCLLLLVGTVIFLLYRQRAQQRDEERAKEIQRLFGYVCRANESVMEIDLDAMSSKEYHIENNALCIEEHPYKTEKNYEGFMKQEDYAEVSLKLTEEKMEELIQNGEEIVFEAQGKGKDGEYRWYIYTIHGLIPDAKHPHNFMLFKRNINELKKKEEESRRALMEALQMAKEASEAKGSFMSRMSHEIRTPLNAVIGYMTLADDCLQEPEKVGDYIQKSQTAARHLLNIINDVLDISAIESGKIKIASEEFNLKELLSSVTLMFYSQAKDKGIDFKVEIHDMTDEMVIGDQLRLNQILMNLLSNAMKFTPAEGSVILSVHQLMTEGQQVRFRLAVSDTGIGMSEEFRQRIFSPFEQETAGTARKYGGSGLGLSITKNLITMMQGSIDVESEEGKGTTFTVHMVFGKSPNSVSYSKVKNDFTKIRALIVDDEKRSCDYMKSLLKRCHVKSDVVYSGESAVRQIMKREGTDYEYDLCLIDWNLTGIDGVETARRIRQECKKQIPIIIASAYDINEIRDAAMAAGVNKLIAKPLFQSTMFDLLVDTYGSYDPELIEHVENKKIDLSGVSVLLVEDNEMNMEIAVGILKKSGMVIDTAVDGKEAYNKFVQSPKNTYQVILMDVQMPVMDGYEATRAIRSSEHEQAKDIPIIAMTANAFREDVTAALSAGMNDHISKPVSYEKLYHLLEKYITADNEGK
ncbi:MAG: response regulator [Clostridia bacterium]|nr:response regulator [Clostridia bacterium]